MNNGEMTKSERTELAVLIRKRERLLKAAAVERSAQLLAEFEQQMDEVFSFDDDAVWQEAHRLAEEALEEANRRIAERCAELGIPAEFAPSYQGKWFGRGQNSAKERRAELRRIAKAKIDVLEKRAKTQIENNSLQAQSELAMHGLKSEAAHKFLEDLNLPEKLMPSITQEDVAGLLPEGMRALKLANIEQRGERIEVQSDDDSAGRRLSKPAQCPL